jgi:glutamate formiminotransferase/formiminotetrahydrofolate cyclodeaminase
MQQRSTGVADAELIKIAVKSMGLDELYPFKPEEKIVEYVLAANEARKLLVDRSVRGFVEETASESPAPGGGSVAATVGSLGAALGTMVANLSSHKRGWDARWEEFSDWAEKGKACQDELLALVDRDTDAFNAIMASWRLPEGSEAEKAAKAEAVQAAVVGAIEVPLRIMEVARDSMEVAEAMAADGLAASLSDAGVGMLCARTAVLGAWYNVRINAGDLEDEARRAAYLERAAAIATEAEGREAKLRATVEERLG